MDAVRLPHKTSHRGKPRLYRDAWMQFVYLPTGDYVSGYIRDLQSVGISVHDYDLWTEETRPIAERTLEHIRQSMNV